MTQPPWSPDFSRAPESAHELWRRITTSPAIAAVIALNLDPQQDEALAAQLGGVQSKLNAAIEAENLSDAEQDVFASFMPELARMARAIAASAQ
jgi:predicted protein tyrosine phosphatase